MQTNIYEATVEHAADLVEQLDLVLLVLSQDANEYPVVHVCDEEGNHLTLVQWFEEKLTDGSKVYKLVLKKGKTA